MWGTETSTVQRHAQAQRSLVSVINTTRLSQPRVLIAFTVPDSDRLEAAHTRICPLFIIQQPLLPQLISPISPTSNPSLALCTKMEHPTQHKAKGTHQCSSMENRTLGLTNISDQSKICKQGSIIKPSALVVLDGSDMVLVVKPDFSGSTRWGAHRAPVCLTVNVTLRVHRNDDKVLIPDKPSKDILEDVWASRNDGSNWAANAFQMFYWQSAVIPRTLIGSEAFSVGMTTHHCCRHKLPDRMHFCLTSMKKKKRSTQSMSAAVCDPYMAFQPTISER